MHCIFQLPSRDILFEETHDIFPFVVGNKLSHILEAITFHSPMQLKQSLRFSRPDLGATGGGLQWNGKIDLLYPPHSISNIK